MELLHSTGDGIDAELLRLEQDGVPTVYDCFLFPWMHRLSAHAIWLESDPPSRLWKVIVSHRGVGRYSGQDLEARVLHKDTDAARVLRETCGADLFTDRGPFDSILDLSTLIQAPTQSASQRSIAQGNALVFDVLDRYLARSA